MSRVHPGCRPPHQSPVRTILLNPGPSPRPLVRAIPELGSGTPWSMRRGSCATMSPWADGLSRAPSVWRLVWCRCRSPPVPRPTRSPGRRQGLSPCCSPGGRSSAPACCSGRRGRATTSARCSSPAGFAWFVAEWDNPAVGSSAVFTIGLVLSMACPALVSIVIFAHPSGRMPGWPERSAVAVLVTGTVILLGVLSAMSYGPRAIGCGDCPTNRAARRRRLGPGRRPRPSAGSASRSSRRSALVGLDRVATASIEPGEARVDRPTVLAGCRLPRRRGLDVRREPRPLVRRQRPARSGGCGSSRPEPSSLVAVAVMLGRVRNRRTRRSLVDIVVELGKTSAAGGLRDALAVRLDDPDLEVALRDRRRSLGRPGRPSKCRHPQSGGDRAVTPLVRDGEHGGDDRASPGDARRRRPRRRGHVVGPTAARQRASAGRGPRHRGRPAGVAGPHRRVRRRRAPPSRTGPARRRPAAARRTDARPAPDPDAASSERRGTVRARLAGTERRSRGWAIEQPARRRQRDPPGSLTCVRSLRGAAARSGSDPPTSSRSRPCPRRRLPTGRRNCRLSHRRRGSREREQSSSTWRAPRDRLRSTSRRPAAPGGTGRARGSCRRPRRAAASRARCGRGGIVLRAEIPCAS